MRSKMFLFVIFVTLHLFEKKIRSIKSKSFSRFAPFQTRWEKFLSEDFLAPFWDSQFLSFKYKIFVYFHENVKTPERLNFTVCGSFCGVKTFFCNNCTIALVWTQKVVSNVTNISSRFSPFQTRWEKFLPVEFLASFSYFLVLKYNFFVNFFKNTSKHLKNLV